MANPSSDDPFRDAGSTPSLTDTADDLQLERNVRLCLGADGLSVHDELETQQIQYRNILDAAIKGNELHIAHALSISKNAVRPAHITYPLPDKTAASPRTAAWITRLLDRAYDRAQRNKRLKILVNPFGGKGLAAKLYAAEAESIFRAAGCTVVDVEETTHEGHARDIAARLDVDAYDVIVCVSGDGTPHEVFNGLALQDRPRAALRKLAVAQIPGGSGNAFSLNFSGTNSASLAALAIVKGVRGCFDLVSISQGKERYLSFLSQAVGIIAESDLGTENIRWMGSARFTYGFLVRLAGKTVYPAQVSVKLAVADKPAIRTHHRDTRHERGSKEWEERQDKQRIAHDDDTTLGHGRFGSISDPLPSDWTTTDMPTLGNFYCGNMCWMMPGSPFFAAALPNDGLADLVTIDGEIPRWDAVKLMLAVENNAIFDRADVVYHKVEAYRITPRLRPGQKEGYISIDGEKVPFAPFQAEVLPGIATVICVEGKGYHATGPPELQAA